MKKLNITETILRDAQQSLLATRMRFEDFAAILPAIDKVGYHSVECWGGATFDSCLRYLDEDPWERLRKLKAALPHTKLQMLLRGQNILGYKHYSDDTVRRFVRASVANGMDIIRIFDALNDLRNIEVAVEETLKCGAEAQGSICYTLSPIHDLESFVRTGEAIEAMGCQSLCIKDMAGIMSPQECYDLVKALKAAIKIPVIVHTHSTTGLGYMTYLKAAEAGADCIDTALSPLSGGTSQPATETLVYALEQMGFVTGVDSSKLKEISDFFVGVRKKYMEDKILEPILFATKTDALTYQVPGGMLSNLVAQLKAQGALDRLDEVLAETPKVREDLGYPPLVTPMSQMVGVQAATNVLTGGRYRLVSTEVKAYLRGEYGRTPGKIKQELLDKIMGGKQPAAERLSASKPAEFPAAKEHLGDLAKSEEDVLSYIAFPQVAEAFLRKRG